MRIRYRTRQSSWNVRCCGDGNLDKTRISLATSGAVSGTTDNHSKLVCIQFFVAGQIDRHPGHDWCLSQRLADVIADTLGMAYVRWFFINVRREAPAWGCLHGNRGPGTGAFYAGVVYFSGKYLIRPIRPKHYVSLNRGT